MCNTLFIFFSSNFVVINNSNYHYRDSSCSCFLHRSWVVLYLQNIMRAHSCLFSAQWGCCKFCCNLPGGYGKPKKDGLCSAGIHTLHRGGAGDAAAARHQVGPYPSSVETCCWGASLCPWGGHLWSEGCSEFWAKGAGPCKYSIVQLARWSRGNLRPKGW